MSQWDIDVAASRGHIAAAETEFEALAVHKSSVQSALDLVATGCKDGPILQALAAVGATLTGATQSVLDRADTAARGTRDAINAYVSGDLEMAATAQQFNSQADG